MKNNINEYKATIKENIKSLVNQNKIEYAREIIEDYEKIIDNDEDIYSVKGIISILDGDMDKAEDYFLKGLTIKEEDFNLLYNLAYLYSITGQKELAIANLKTSLEYVENEDEKEEVYNMLKELGIDNTGLEKDDPRIALDDNEIESKRYELIRKYLG